MKQPISHSGWFPASTGHLDGLGMKCGGAQTWGVGPKNETQWAGLALLGVKCKLGVESFACLMTANIPLVTARWTAIKPTLVLDSNFVWGSGG